MGAYDKYVLVLCLIVFAALTAFFALLITRIVKMRLHMIKGGLADNEIENEQQEKAKQKNLAARFINRVFSSLFCILVIAIFALSLGIRFSESSKVGSTPIVKVVRSGSMATKYEKNTYLDENHLTNRIQKYDLIVVNKLPKEEDLKLYDVVVYEADGYLIIHRIVGIVEPDETHESRQFLLQGDANQYPDRFPVYYSQMKGIYSNIRIPFIGSFVDFMHSPAGYLCFLLIVFAYILSPMLDKKEMNEFKARKTAIEVQKQYQSISFSKSIFSKALVAAYMKERFGEEQLFIKEGKNFTKTGLSLPDTYYIVQAGKRKCFAYVYCTKKGGTIVRFAGFEGVEKEFENVKKTAFPRIKNEQWFVLKLDQACESDSQCIAQILEAVYQSSMKDLCEVK